MNPRVRTLLLALTSSAVAVGLAAEVQPGSGPQKRSPTNTVTTPSPAHTNRLAREKSPYLLQHQHNPVDWYAWGDEAFAKAKKEDKPIFLSIGYSTCHWCHVMERESFENETLAKFLNEHFVSIKVDREERPDVDKIYMTAVQALGQGGGWPLNVFLTPDRKPFYGGTYFPPEPRFGRPSFLQLLQRLQELWSTQRADVEGSAKDMHEQLARFTAQTKATDLQLSPALIDNAVGQFKEEYDSKNGGFGGAPKFPRPTLPSLVLRHSVRGRDEEGIRMVLHTCERMAAGGMYDQLGGGFARYSTDAQWLVPHFEKMLYDNAQLVHLYLDAHLVSGRKEFADVANDVIRYVLRDMTHPEGGFYSAEDADSEGHEGKFYCWTKKELSALLTVEEFNVAVAYYGITEDGNFTDHSHPSPLTGQNVLHVANPKLPDADASLLSAARKKMLAARSKRIRPHLDDKILTSWNGLMLGAVARAHAVLGEETYLKAAEKNLEFLKSKLWDAKTGTLHHRWRDGERDKAQLLDDYACLLNGVIDLYEATLNPKHLEFAVELADSMIARFYDPQAGGFFQSAAGAADLILRVKEDYDGAEPSGNSVACIALLRLGAITDNKSYREAVGKTLKLFGERFQKLPQAVPLLLYALDNWLDEPRRIVITGDPDSVEAKALRFAAHRTYQPNKVILGVQGPVEPFAKTLPAGKKPAAYVCTGTECKAPTSDPIKLAELIR